MTTNMHNFSRIVIGLLILVLGLSMGWAQTDSTLETSIYPLDNPRNAVARHLYYLNNNHSQYDPVRSAEALSGEGL